MRTKTPAQPLNIPAEGDASFRRAAVFFLFLTEFSLYFAGLFHGLVADDYVFRSVHNRPISSLWTQPADPQGHWRPFSYSLKYLLFSFFGESSFPWHLLNIAVHFASILILFVLLLKVSRGFGVKGVTGALVAAFVIQIHPAAVQNVLWASGFAELVALFLLVCTAYLALPILLGRQQGSTGRSIAVAFAFAAALLSKESAIVFPVVLLCLVLLATDEPWWGALRRIWNEDRKIMAALVIPAAAFLVVYSFIGGRPVINGLNARPNGFLDVAVRAMSMLMLPTDAMTGYRFIAISPVIPVFIALSYLLVAFVAMRVVHVRWKSFLVLIVLVAVCLAPYIPGGSMQLRLMDTVVTFAVIATFIVLIRDRTWTEPGKFHWMIKGFLAVYIFCTMGSSFSAVSDWHVADKFGKSIRLAFEDFRDDTGRGSYTFAAVPTRIRQAPIMGEPSTDFRGQMRQDGVDTTLDLHTLLRIVLLSRDSHSANIRVAGVAPNALVLQTNSNDQFFLPAAINGPQELPVGTIVLEGPYTLRVLETTLNNKAVSIEVSGSPSDLQNLVFYDDIDGRFMYLEEYANVNATEGDND